MIVSNIIIVIFCIITGTFVICTASTNKRSELKKKGIGYKQHDDEGPDILFRGLSNFGVMRRSLSPMLFDQFSSIHHLKNELNVPKIKIKNRNVIEKLKSSVILRDNILYIFSYLLHGHESGLTEDQYTSLQMVYELLKKKMVYMYNILPILSKLNTANKNQQTSIILLSLMKNLPPYFQCTAKFLVNEIQAKRIDLNVLLKSTAFEKFNYLANIDSDMISKGKRRIAGEEMREYDKYSNITQKALGPVFVKLLRNLHADKESLSQELFGLILMNLPNPNDDPVLEENIRYLYDLTKNNLIDHKDWNSIGKDLVGKDAYTLVFSVLFRILNSNVRMTVKDAAVYVYHHLKLVTVPIQANPNLKYMHRLVKQDIDIGMLLSAIMPQEFGPDAIRMKDRLLTYFMRNYKTEDLDKILIGFNKYAYRDPLDLLIAFLTRLANRIPSLPNGNLHLLLQPATALLPALIMRKYARAFTPFVSPEVDVSILLESLKTPDLDPLLQSTIDSIKLELIAQPQISVLLSTLMPTEKNKCLIPRQCLMNTFQQIQRLQDNIPMTLNTKIQNIAYILKTASTIQYQAQGFFRPYAVKPMDVNIYNVDRESPVVVSIETDNAHNVPIGLNGNPFIWNIDKYINKLDPAVQVGVSKTPGWETGTMIGIDHTDSKLKPSTTTIGQVQRVTEYVPSREDTTDQPLTLNFSLTTTSSYVPSQITHKPTRKPQKEQPHQTRYTITESPVRETDSEIEYSHPQETVSREKEISHQPITSEEIENQTFSPEETDKEEFTTRKSTQVTKVTRRKTEPPQKAEEKATSIENMSTAVVLPPAIEPDRPLTIQLSDNGVPVVTTGDDHNATVPDNGLVLPQIKELLKSPNINDLLGNSDTPIVTQVLQPLSAIFGKNYIKKILKNVDTKLYSTNIALLSAILKKAQTYPQVAKNTNLMSLIRKYIATIEYVSPTILLPVVVSSKKLISDVVYSTYNPHDLTHSGISENPPDETSPDTVTIPLVNPKIWLQSINPSDPYADLLPTLEEGDVFAVTIRPLKKILTPEKIIEILGSDFQPLVYPNKGALLITLLHKFQKAKMIQRNAELKALIDMYIYAIEAPSMNIQVSEDNFVKMMSETTGHWQPELTSLISALPTAQNDVEVTMIEQIENFLADPTLLEKLHIAKPPSTMSRGDLLSKIILIALSGKIQLENRILKAFRYYKDKVEFTDMGALPIMWMWVEVYVVKAEVNLGNMIQQTVDFNQLAYKEKLAYNDLVTYLAQNPNLLQSNEDFEFQKYKTQGQFIKGLFKYLLKNPQVNKQIRKNIQILLPHVMLTGPGAAAIPSFSGF